MIFHSTDLTDLCQSWLLSSPKMEVERKQKMEKPPKDLLKPTNQEFEDDFPSLNFQLLIPKHLYFFQNVRHLKTDNCFSSLTKSTRPIRPTRPVMPSPLFGGFRLSVEKQTIAELAAFCPLGAPGRKSLLYRSSSSSCDRKMKEGVE